MKNGILYAGLGFAVFFLGIVFPFMAFKHGFKPNYLVGLVFWLVVGIASWSELQNRKKQ